MTIEHEDRLRELTTERRTILARCETRADESTKTATYDFTGVAVPFGDTYEVWGVSETFTPDTVFDIDPGIVRWQHAEPIGRISAATTDPTGLIVTGHISHTPRGDEAATLLADGVITRLSIGFEPIEFEINTDEDLITYTHVRLYEVSLVEFPAYDNARITETRNHKERPTIMPNTTDVETRLDALEQSITDTADMFTRTLETRLAEALRAHTPESVAPRYRQFGQFIKSLQRGEADALALATEFNERAAGEIITRSYTGGVLADTVAHAPWIGDAIRLIDKGRPVLNAFNRAPLPAEGNQVEYGVLESNTVTVAKQTNEGDTLTTGKVTVGSEFASVGTYGGYSELSFQAVQRASVNILNLTYKAQLIAYAAATEAAVRAALNNIISANITATHNLEQVATPTAADWLALLVDAADAYEDAALSLEGLYLSKDLFKSLVTMTDTTGRLQFQVIGNGVNSVGTISSPLLEASIGSIPVRLLPGAADGTAAFYNAQALTTLESAGAPLTLQDQNIAQLTNAYSVFGYLAVAPEIPDAILPVTFAAS